jgi:hypothetical protein
LSSTFAKDGIIVAGEQRGGIIVDGNGATESLVAPPSATA